MQRTCWNFTINNYTQADLDQLQAVPDSSPYAIVYGKEVAPTTGTPHLQGVLYTKEGSRVRRSAAERLLGGRAWLGPVDSLEGAIGYAIKGGDWWANLPDLESRQAQVLEARKYGEEHTWLGSVFLQYPDESICDASHNLHLFTHKH